MTDDTVPKDALRELVDEWREEADDGRETNRKWTGEKKYIHYRDGKATALERIADELEAVLEDE